MRWIVVIILAYLALAAQNVLGILVCIRTESMGRIAPDIIAAAAVFFALSVRNVQDVTIACWVLGIGLDLATQYASAIGPTTLG